MKRKTFQPSLEHLESRELLAASIGFSNGVVKITGDADHNAAVVKYSGNKVIATVTSTPSNGFSLVPSKISKSYNASSVKKIEFFGNGGDDSFDNRTKIGSYAHGGSGDDTLWGGSGIDVLVGGSDNDRIYGNSANDVLFGGSGNDYLSGGSGHDSLYGQLGVDTLKGGSGNDGLFGGGDGNEDRDYLYGESGKDRFLTASDYDYIQDIRGEDAHLKFRKGTASSDWTDREIEVMDVALRALHRKTGNTRLLKDTTSSSPLTIYKDKATSDYAGLNRLTPYTETWKTWNYLKFKWDHHSRTTYTREIRIADWSESGRYDGTSFSQRDQDAAATLVHEIGHNWDSTMEMQKRLSATAAQAWSDFTKVKGYAKRYSGDTYGGTNQREDWAVSWEVYFRSNYSKAISSPSIPSGQKKILDTFFANVAKLS